MNWFVRANKVETDDDRIMNNILRLENLKNVVHDLGYYVSASQSGGYLSLQKLLEDTLLIDKEKIWNKLNEANIGENNQKIALDSPFRFQNIMRQAEEMLAKEIFQENKKLTKKHEKR